MTRPGSETTPAPSAAVESLLVTLRPTVADTVDTLQLAAILESLGMTDELARDQYDVADVFALATLLRAAAADRTGPGDTATGHADAVGPPRPPAPTAGVATVSHGVIYLLPALSFPALLDVVGVRYSAVALVVGASVGWVWAVLATWRAYGLLTLDGRRAAEDRLRRSTLTGSGLAVAVGAVLVLLSGAPPVAGLVAASVALTQVGVTLHFFLGRRLLLSMVLVAQGGVGLANLLKPTVVPSTWVLGVFVLVAVTLLTLGGALTPHRVRVETPAAPPRDLGPLIWYATASVAFLLLPQALFLRVGGALPLALAGLFLSMGFVEWRGATLSARLRDELSRVATVPHFRLRAVRWLIIEALACAAVTSLAACGVLLLVRRAGLLSTGVLVVALATIPLATAYLVALALANSRAYTWLAATFTGGAAVESTLWGALATPPALAFATAVAVLLVALVVGLLARPVDRFR